MVGLLHLPRTYFDELDARYTTDIMIWFVRRQQSMLDRTYFISVRNRERFHVNAPVVWARLCTVVFPTDGI